MRRTRQTHSAKKYLPPKRENLPKIFPKHLDKRLFPCYNRQAKKECSSLIAQDLGVAQLVARYLGVVEAASSSLVTQTKNRES